MIGLKHHGEYIEGKEQREIVGEFEIPGFGMSDISRWISQGNDGKDSRNKGRPGFDPRESVILFYFIFFKGKSFGFRSIK